MTNTNNYGLKKPVQTDFYNVDDFNSNMDVLDAKIKEMETVLSQKEILRFGSKVDFPSVPTLEQEGCLFIDQSTNKIWHWTGATYTEIFAGVQLGETPETAYPGDKGKTAYDHSQLTGNPHYTTAADIGAATTQDVSMHSEQSILSGAHGLRYRSGKLEYFESDTWHEIKTIGNAGVAPGNLPNLTIKEEVGSLKLTWQEPQDDAWKGTKIVRKVGSFPTNIKDGTLILDNQERNKINYVDSNVTAGVTYCYHFFPYSVNDVNNNISNRVSGVPEGPKVYGVRVDTTMTNPETAVTYTDDAIKMVAGSNDWDMSRIFKDIKPCILKHGVVQYYLNKSDFTKKENGEAAPIDNIDEGDVMIEVPKIGFKILNDGTYIEVKITDNPNGSADGYHYYAHTRDVEGDRDKLYIGAYQAYSTNSHLRSISGVVPTGNLPMKECRTQTNANGAGYDIIGFYQLVLIQCLYLIKYKNLDCQEALGYGFVDAASSLKITGVTNANAMCYGDKTAKNQRVKLFGLEDFWGNSEQYIDGIYCDTSKNILTAYKDFEMTAAYFNVGSAGTLNTDTYSYVNEVQGTTERGFLPAKTSSVKNPLWVDDGTLYKGSNIALFGGGVGSGDSGGIFNFRCAYYSPTFKDWKIGTRIMYL